MADSRSRKPAQGEPGTSALPGHGGPDFSATPEYYSVLGLSPEASQEAISAAYRRQAAHYSRRSGSEAAAQRLRVLNAAYAVLGSSARRADYDRLLGVTAQPAASSQGQNARRRAAEREHSEKSRPGRSQARHGGGALELAALAMVALVGLGAGIVVLRGGMNIGTPVLDAFRSVGLAERPDTGEPGPDGTPLPTVLVAAAGPTTTPATLETQFEGTTVKVEPTEPGLRSDVVVTTTVVRNGKPLGQQPLYLIAHYRTVDERWPSGTATVLTDEHGVGKISFNVGIATRSYTVKVDVIAEVEGQQMVWHGAFTPR